MARRKQVELEPEDEQRRTWRANQVNTRIRVALWALEPNGGPLSRARIEADENLYPGGRLHDLLELAERIRPLCAAKVRNNVLPEKLGVSTR